MRSLLVVVASLAAEDTRWAEVDDGEQAGAHFSKVRRRAVPSVSRKQALGNASSAFDTRLHFSAYEFFTSKAQWKKYQPRYQEFNNEDFIKLIKRTGLVSNAFGIDLSAPRVCGVDATDLYTLIEVAAADWVSAPMFHLDFVSIQSACHAHRKPHKRALAEGGAKDKYIHWQRKRACSPFMLPERPLAFTQRPGFLGGRTVDDALESLRLDGFIRIDDWGMLDMEALTKEVNEMLHGTKGGSNLAGAQLQRFGHPAALDSLMNDESLAHLMREYSGGTMRYEGTSVVHLQPGKTGSKTYSPVEWHHDRCGRRLKAFVFLKDVVPESYPTQIATGTNSLWYYWYGGPNGRTTRHPSHTFVESKYNIATITGKRGGGFIFDSNSLHRATPTGSAERLVAFLEFHVHGKIPQLNGRGVPCPNRALTVPGGRNHGGYAGFPLYPNEGGLATGAPRSL